MAPCMLLAGAFAKGLQALLALAAFFVLVVKRQRERPRRSWQVWRLDVSKQALAMAAAHVTGLAAATLIAGSRGAGGDECAWYLLQYTTDTTLGTALAFAGLRCVTACARCGRVRSLELTGDYGNPPSLCVWVTQTVSWAAVTIVSRALCGAALFGNTAVLSGVAAGVAAPFKGHEDVFLLTVMVACPLCMNACQLCVQDSFLKQQTSRGPESREVRDWADPAYYSDDEGTSILQTAGALSPRHSPAADHNDRL